MITPEIKAERIGLWTEALRSGEYDQAKGYLKSVDGYCCLGVACEVAIKNGLNIESDDRGYRTIRGEDAFYENLTLPHEVQEWYGLDSGNPEIELPEDEDDEGFAAELSELNDTYGYDFDELADLIDDQLKPKVEVKAAA